MIPTIHDFSRPDWRLEIPGPAPTHGAAHVLSPKPQEPIVKQTFGANEGKEAHVRRTLTWPSRLDRVYSQL